MSSHTPLKICLSLSLLTSTQSGTTTSRRSSSVSQQLELVSSSPQTPENRFYDSIRSRRRGSSATATHTPARFGLSREQPEPVTPRSPTAFFPPEPVSRRGSLTLTTPSGGLFMDPRVRNPVPITPSTIATIPEESPSENTPRASGRKRTHSTSSSPTIPPESTSTDSVNATSAALSEEDDTAAPRVPGPLRKGSVYLAPRSAFAGPATTVRRSVRNLPLPAVETEEKNRKIEEHEAEMEDRRDKEDEEMAGTE
ncbi:MAG: hypothetical protein Q9208_000817 [Pyrenodesmia sp. 3 TL-2023]